MGVFRKVLDIFTANLINKKRPAVMTGRFSQLFPHSRRGNTNKNLLSGSRCGRIFFRTRNSFLFLLALLSHLLIFCLEFLELFGSKEFFKLRLYFFMPFFHFILQLITVLLSL